MPPFPWRRSAIPSPPSGRRPRRHVSDIYFSVSTDGGATFGAPVRVNDIEGDARASGEQAARVAVGAGNAIHVAWPARRDGISVIRYAGIQGWRPDVLASGHHRRREDDRRQGMARDDARL